MRIVAMVLLSMLFAPLALAEVKTDIEYARAGDESLKLDAGVPDGTGPFPIVILVHGGGWSGGDKAADPPLFDPLIKSNFTWFSINYRLAPKNRWPACYEDVQTAIRWVKSHAAEYKGDPTRVAIIGYSAGGHIVMWAVTHADKDTQVQAVVGLAPSIDLEIDLPQRGGLSPSLQQLLDQPHELTDESRKLLHELSPINHLKPGLPPMLIVHGDADKSVLHPGSVNFQEKLKELGVACDLITLPKAPHAIAQWENFDPAWKTKTIAWLKDRLGN